MIVPSVATEGFLVESCTGLKKSPVGISVPIVVGAVGILDPGENEETGVCVLDGSTVILLLGKEDSWTVGCLEMLGLLVGCVFVLFQWIDGGVVSLFWTVASMLGELVSWLATGLVGPKVFELPSSIDGGSVPTYTCVGIEVTEFLSSL